MRRHAQNLDPKNLDPNLESVAREETARPLFADRLRARRAADAPAALLPDAEGGPEPAGGTTPELMALTAAMSQTVRGALASLPGEQRARIEAAFFEGYTHSELAHRFGLPLGTVKTRIRTGMIRMRSTSSASVIR